MTETAPGIPAAWVTAGLEAVIAHHKQQRQPFWNCPSSGEAAALIAAVRPLIAAEERERIREMAIRNQAVCTGDEGTSCYFADLIREPAKDGSEGEAGDG